MDRNPKLEVAVKPIDVDLPVEVDVDYFTILENLCRVARKRKAFAGLDTEEFRRIQQRLSEHSIFAAIL